MSLFRFLHKCLGSPTPAPVKNRSRVALGVETLEDRKLLATTASFLNGVLTITGDDLRNEVTLTQHDTLNTLRVHETRHGRNVLLGSFVSNQVKQFNINLRDGDDDLTYQLANNTANLFSKKMAIDLGKGDDHCYLLYANGINGTSGPLKSNLEFSVLGGGGKDTLAADFASKIGGRLNVFADLGEGDDQAFVNLWGDIDGAAVNFDLRGGAGNDYLGSVASFDMVSGRWSDIHVNAGSTLTINLDGGKGMDEMWANYKGDCDGAVKILMNGGTENDDMHAIVRLTDGSTGAFTGIVWGNHHDDTLSFNLVNQASKLKSLLAVADGGAGTDTAGTITANVQQVNMP